MNLKTEVFLLKKTGTFLIKNKQKNEKDDISIYYIRSRETWCKLELIKTCKGEENNYVDGLISQFD